MGTGHDAHAVHAGTVVTCPVSSDVFGARDGVQRCGEMAVRCRNACTSMARDGKAGRVLVGACIVVGA